MAQYGTNALAGNGITVSIDIGVDAKIVTGSTGALFLTYLHAGDLIQFQDDSVFYQIASITSNLILVLTADYYETIVDKDFLGVTDFTPNSNLPKMNQGDLLGALIYNKALDILDGLTGTWVLNDIDKSMSITVGGITFKIVLTTTTWEVFINDQSAGGGSV